MSNLSAFMHANVEQIENYKFAALPPVSKGEDGQAPCCGKSAASPLMNTPASATPASGQGAGARQKGSVHPAT